MPLAYQNYPVIIGGVHKGEFPFMVAHFARGEKMKSNITIKHIPPSDPNKIKYKDVKPGMAFSFDNYRGIAIKIDVNSSNFKISRKYLECSSVEHAHIIFPNINQFKEFDLGFSPMLGTLPDDTEVTLVNRLTMEAEE